MLKTKRIQLFRLLITSTGLLVFLCFTNPNRLGVGYLFVPVVLLALLVYFATLLFFETVALYRPTRPRLVAMFISVLPCFGLLLKSVGQLTLKDVALLLLLIVAGSFYISVLRFGKVQE